MSVTLQHQPAPYSRLLKRFALVAFILGGLGELLILVAAFRSDFHLGFSVYVSAGALAVFMLLLFLIFERIIMADARRMPAHVPDVEPFDGRHAGQEIAPELGQRIPIRGRQAHSGDDDARKLHADIR